MEIHKPDHTQKRGIYARSVKARMKDIATGHEMAELLDTHNGSFGEQYGRAFALAHAQVTDSTAPVRMFVVNEDFVQEPNDERFFFPHRIILNAKILKAPETIPQTVPRREHYKDEHGKMRSRFVAKLKDMSNVIHVEEACMSFPNRKPKQMWRYYRVKVQYQYPVTIFGFTFLWTKREWVRGLKAHIFQHEIDHFDAINIYYDY